MTVHKLNHEQSDDSCAGAGGVAQGIAAGGAGEGSLQSIDKRTNQAGVGASRVKPKGSSITLKGCGKQDGSDINNSMSLATFYQVVIFGASDGRVAGSLLATELRSRGLADTPVR